MNIEEKRKCVDEMKRLVKEADSAINNKKFQKDLAAVLDGLVAMHGKMTAIQKKYKETEDGFWKDGGPYIMKRKKAVTPEEKEMVNLYDTSIVLGTSVEAPGGCCYGCHSLITAVKTLYSSLNRANLEMLTAFKFALDCLESEKPIRKLNNKDSAFKHIAETLEADKARFKK